MKLLHIGGLLAATLLLSELILFPFKVWLKSEYESELYQVATNLNSFILNELSEPIYISIGIATFVQSHDGNVSDQVMNDWLEPLFDHTSHTRNIGIAPDNVIQFIYPQQGNEAALGLDYRDLPEQWPAVEALMSTGESLLIGPIRLVQGSHAFAYRRPVFVNGAYWGLISTIIDSESILSSIADEANSYDIGIRISNAQDDVIYAKALAEAGNARLKVLQRIPLPGTYWTLETSAAGNSQAVWTARTALWLVLLLTLGLAYWVGLNYRRRKAEQRHIQQVKAQFLASVSHELKTPLTVLHGSLALLQQPGIQEENRQQLVQSAVSHQKRLNRLIMDLLDFNLALNHQLPIHLQSVDLPVLLHEVAEPYQSIFADAQLHFISNIPGHGSCKLYTDPDRLKQVLNHLLDNAAKFCRPGDQVELNVSINDKITIQIKDTGPGIPEQLTGLSAAYFSQNDSSDTRSSGGTGLGLALCREIVSLLKGQMTIQSDPSTGTRVTLAWPLHTEK